MEDATQDIANESGLPLEQARKGLGAILAFLKNKLGADFGGVQSALPGSEAAMGAYDMAKGSGGLMGTVTGMLGKAFGGGDVMGSLAKTGLDPGQIAKFLPAVLAVLQKYLPPELFGKVRDLIPRAPAA